MRRDYYSFTTLDGRVDYDRFEKALERHEWNFGGILHDVRLQSPVDVEAKARLSLYVVMMRMRVPSRERRALPAIDSALESFPWDRLASLAAGEGRSAEALSLSRDRVEAKQRLRREILWRGATDLGTQAPEIRKVVETIAKMTWQFFVAPPGHFFVTTDSPVFHPRGLADDTSFLVFPISSEVVLFATRLSVPDRVYVAASRDQALLLNRLILGGADEFAYGCAAEQGIVDAWENSAR